MSFFIFQQLHSQISQIDINADIAFCNETLQFFLDTETVFVTIIHVVKFNTIIVIDVIIFYCYQYCFSILITLFLFLFVSSDSAWQGAPQQPSQQSLSVVTTVWGVTQTNDSNSMMNNSFRGGTYE